MTPQLTSVFLWTDTLQVKRPVAASAGSESIEVYYALESRCSRHGSSCTVSSQVWFADSRRYWIEEILGRD